MQPTPPSPYGTRSYARPGAPVRFAQFVETADGARLATFVYGPGQAKAGGILASEPVLCLHGNGGSHGTFAKVIDTLVSAGLSVVAFDARGQGQSTRGEAPLTYELLAADAVCVLDRLGIATAHVVGHSDGGIEALLLARDHAGRVRSIVAGGANISPEGVVDEWDIPASVATNRAWASWAEGDEVPADVDPALLPSAADARRSAELLQLMLDEPHIEASSLTGISCPACILVGEHDCIAREETERIAAAIEGARLITVPGVGHSLPRQAPDSVCCQVLVNVVLTQGRHAPGR